MTVIELGALGEFVAAIAVVASLIYVGFQISQSRTQMKANAAQARTDSLVSMQAAFMAIPELVEAQRKESTGETLTELEQRYISLELHTRTSMLENWHYQRSLGQLDQALTKRLDLLRVYRRSDFACAWWDDAERRRAYSESFVDHANGVLTTEKEAL